MACRFTGGGDVTGGGLAFGDGELAGEVAGELAGEVGTRGGLELLDTTGLTAIAAVAVAAPICAVTDVVP